MKASGMSVREMSREVDRAGGLFRSGTHHGFLWNQMLFTLRRTIYSVTLALGAMGVAAVAIGFQFNSMLEQQSLAFRRFTGSVGAANKEVDFLFNLAAHGPFAFQQVIQGSRQLMAFGFTVQRTNWLLTNLQDAMAGMGLDQAALDRATLALGQIQSSGRLLGQDLRQLEQLGLVNPEDLAHRLGIDPRQVSNIGALNIPSAQAIDAIVAYWRKRFSGAAVDFQKTWVGQWSTFKDYASQTFGFIVRDWQTKLEVGVIPRLTEIFQTAGAGARTGGAAGAFSAIDVKYGTNTLGIFKGLVFFGRQLWSIFVSLEKIFLEAWQRLQIGGRALYIVGAGLWVIAHALQILSPILSWVITLWIAERTAIILLAIATKRKVFWDAISVAWEKRKVYWTWLSIGASYAYVTALWILNFAQFQYTRGAILSRAATWLWTAALYAAAVAQYALAAGLTILRNAVWALTLALEVNPIVLLITAVVLLTAGLVILYFKWDWFHKKVNALFNFIFNSSNPIAAAIRIAFWPITAAVKAVQELIKHWRELHGMISGAAHNGWVRAAAGGFLNAATGGMGGSLLLPFTGMASGGHVLSGGVSLVGERGPELLSLPAGATVAPLGGNPVAKLGGILGKNMEKTLNLRVPVYLDRDQIGEALASYQLDVAASG